MIINTGIEFADAEISPEQQAAFEELDRLEGQDWVMDNGRSLMAFKDFGVGLDRLDYARWLAFVKYARLPPLKQSASEVTPLFNPVRWYVGLRMEDI